MLGLMFYKFLSDKTIDTFRVASGMIQNPEQEVIEAYGENYAQYPEPFIEMMSYVL